MRKRAIVTLATGSQYYYRMALALMISAHKFGGDRYDYFIFSDQSKLPYYQVPSWLNVIRLSERYYEHKDGKNSRGEAFRIKTMILSDHILNNHDTLFLDADCYVFKDCFEEIFALIEQHSMAVYGEYMSEVQLWGKINLSEVAAKAGYSVKNMWLNSGFIGRSTDKWGFHFIEKYESLMKDYPFRPYIQSKFWQNSDEPYLATAFQLVYKQKHKVLPINVPSPSSDIYITTYDSKIDMHDLFHPVVYSNYIKGAYYPAIVHFLNGIEMNPYRKLINKTVNFDWKGTIMRPYFRGQYTLKRLKYYCKRLTNLNITESRDI